MPGVRIISIGDGIDFPSDDDWLKIQIQFLINEMPVTDTSQEGAERHQAGGRQTANGSAPPLTAISSTAARSLRSSPPKRRSSAESSDLYNNEGWGYKKIANHLTDMGVPTPRMSEQMRKEAAGEETHKRQAKNAWAIVTVQGILDNDFYIGTLRQGKYTRAKINGKEMKRDEGEHIVIENHHQPIIDYRTFATTRALREKRTTLQLPGREEVNDNVYSGFLECGDCGSPMFAMSRSDLRPPTPAAPITAGDRQGLHQPPHPRGQAGRAAESLRAEGDGQLRRHAGAAQRRPCPRAGERSAKTEQSADHLAEVLDDLQEELKATKRQRIRDIMKHPEHEEAAGGHLRRAGERPAAEDRRPEPSNRPARPTSATPSFR